MASPDHYSYEVIHLTDGEAVWCSRLENCAIVTEGRTLMLDCRVRNCDFYEDGKYVGNKLPYSTQLSQEGRDLLRSQLQIMGVKAL